MDQGLRRRLLLAAPAIVLACMDAAITLAGQSPRYWEGDYGSANEASPTFFWLLTIHPGAFVLGIAAWLTVYASAIVLVTEVLALIFSIAVALGHAFGISTWMLFQFEAYQAVNALMLVTAVGLGLAIHAGRNLGPAHFAFRGWSSRRRHALAVALVAVGVYLFLVPH